MIDILRKTLFTGLGMAFITKEKLETLTRDLVRVGELSEEEGKSLFEELSAKSEEAGKEVRKHIDKTVKEVLASMDVATSDDIARIDRELGDIRKQIADLGTAAGE